MEGKERSHEWEEVLAVVVGFPMAALKTCSPN